MKKILALMILIYSGAFSQNVSDKLLLKNHCEASSNYMSTYQLYTVISIEDADDNLREICLTGSDFVYAVQDEWGLNYDDFDILMKKIKSNQNRIFEFRNKSSLERINRIEYTSKELTDFGIKIKIDSIVKNLELNKQWSYFAKDEKEQLMMAHLLFNYGIQTGTNECFGGEELQIFNGY